jgi:hypothetical protein
METGHGGRNKSTALSVRVNDVVVGTSICSGYESTVVTQITDAPLPACSVLLIDCENTSTVRRKEGRTTKGVMVRANAKAATRRVVLAGAMLAGLATLAAASASASVYVAPRTVPNVIVIAPSPDRGNGTNQLFGVSCATNRFCMAVGYSVHPNGSGTRTLIEKWNGTSWSISLSPNTGNGPTLFGVSCLKPAGSSQKFCMAVGSYVVGSTSHTLIETFNGTNWSISTSPASGTQVDLYGVSCTSATFCQAVGYVGNPYQTLIETWNGTSWSITPSPNLSTVDDQLTAVSCTSTIFCEAVGNGWSGGPSLDTLIETWNGTVWTIASSPPPPGPVPSLGGISCTSTTFCDAVGAYSLGASGAGTLVENWNGTNWTVVPSPNQGTNGSELNGVSCTSPTFCEAADVYATTSSTAPLVETWDGTNWTIDPSLGQGTGSQLNGASCTSSAFCVAAGEYSTTGSIYRTLIESGP